MDALLFVPNLFFLVFYIGNNRSPPITDLDRYPLKLELTVPLNGLYYVGLQFLVMCRQLYDSMSLSLSIRWSIFSKITLFFRS